MVAGVAGIPAQWPGAIDGMPGFVMRPELHAFKTTAQLGNRQVVRSVVVAFGLPRPRGLGGVSDGGWAGLRPGLDGIQGWRCHSARGTVAPINHFGFVDLKPMRVAGGEARCRTDRAIDVKNGPTSSADQVMVVVPHPVFIPGWRTRRLDSAHQMLGHQNGQRVVHGLARNRPNRRPHILSQFVGGGVRMGRHCAQGGQPLCGHLQPVLAHDLFHTVVHAACYD